MILSTFHTSAQYGEDDDGAITLKNFKADLSRLKIQYLPPRGYKSLYKSYSASTGTFLLSASRHQLQAQKDSVFIYFAIIDIDTSQALSNRLKKFGFNVDVNRNYIQGVADTLMYPIFQDPMQLSISKYNADRSGTYDVQLKLPYKRQYSNCKVMYIHKENRADILIYYFFNSESASKLSKHIKRISQRIRFLP